MGEASRVQAGSKPPAACRTYSEMIVTPAFNEDDSSNAFIRAENLERSSYVLLGADKIKTAIGNF